MTKKSEQIMTQSTQTKTEKNLCHTRKIQINTYKHDTMIAKVNMREFHAGPPNLKNTKVAEPKSCVNCKHKKNKERKAKRNPSKEHKT